MASYSLLNIFANRTFPCHLSSCISGSLYQHRLVEESQGLWATRSPFLLSVELSYFSKFPGYLLMNANLHMFPQALNSDDLNERCRSFKNETDSVQNGARWWVAVMKEVHGLFTSKLSMLPRPIYKSVLRNGQEQGCSTEYSIGSVVLRIPWLILQVLSFMEGP